MLSSQDDEYESSSNILEAKMDNVKNISILLKAVNFKETALLCATEHGLKVTVDDSKSFIANSYIKNSLFRHYLLKEDVIFRINLTILLECLNIFGSSSSSAFELSYFAPGHPLVLLLEENGVLTNCSIKTLSPDSSVSFDFDQSDVISKIILRSESLKEAFSELDPTSEILEFEVKNEKPFFRISTFGFGGSYHWEFPNSTEMMDLFSCREDQTLRYRMQLIKPAIKALQVSSKTSMRFNSRGFLCMQFMIRLEESENSFSEFLCAPDFDEEEE